MIRGYVGGRGAGKSRIGAYDLVKRAQSKRRYMVIAPTFPDLKDYTYPALQEVCEQCGLQLNLRLTDFRGTLETMAGGTCDLVLHSGHIPDNLRGPNLSGVWLDEASMMHHDVFRIVMFCLREKNTTGWLTATFTPKGKRNWTYQVFGPDASQNTETFHSRSQDNPWLPKSLLEEVRAQITEKQRLQEEEGMWLDLEGGLIDADQLAQCQEDGIEWKSYPPPVAVVGDLYIGYDPARSAKGDRSVIWTWEKIGDVAYARECLVMRGESFAGQEAALYARLKRPQVVKCQIDEGTLGKQLAENARTRFPRIATPVALTDGTMARIANQLAVAVERHRVRLPIDEDIRNDWLQIPLPEMRAGRDAMPSAKRTEIGHADRFWAAALGYDALLQTRPYKPPAPPRAYPSSGGR